MSRLAGAVALLALLTMGAFAWWSSAREGGAPAVPEPAPRAAAVDSGGDAEALEELRAALAAEAARREKLAREVAELRAALAALEADRVAAADEEEVRADVAARRAPRAPRFDEEALRDSGLDEREAGELRERFEQARLDALYLRDRAVREGWHDDDRYLLERVESRWQLRDELGADRFDWYQYASGRPNRVRVRDVLGGSEAERAGLISGDTVYAYAGRRIFNRGELRWLTATGVSGERVELEVLRDGESLRMRVARGPLGVYIDEDRVAPPPLR